MLKCTKCVSCQHLIGVQFYFLSLVINDWCIQSNIRLIQIALNSIQSYNYIYIYLCIKQIFHDKKSVFHILENISIKCVAIDFVNGKQRVGTWIHIKVVKNLFLGTWMRLKSHTKNTWWTQTQKKGTQTVYKTLNAFHLVINSLFGTSKKVNHRLIANKEMYHNGCILILFHVSKNQHKIFCTKISMNCIKLILWQNKNICR